MIRGVLRLLLGGVSRRAHFDLALNASQRKGRAGSRRSPRGRLGLRLRRAWTSSTISAAGAFLHLPLESGVAQDSPPRNAAMDRSLRGGTACAISMKLAPALRCSA